LFWCFVLRSRTMAATPEPSQGQVSVVRCEEGSKLTLPAPDDWAKVQRAWYGAEEHAWEVGTGIGDLCTDIVIERIKLCSGTVMASNACLGFDPAPGVVKVLLVELSGSVQAAVSGAAERQCFESPEAVTSAPRWVAFVRHAQAGHNVDEALVMNPDNHLTEIGREQAHAARAAIAGEALRSAELIITSPLMRAMQTTALLLGDDDAGVRVMVHQIGTERWSAPCDEGTRKSELLETVPERFRQWEGWDVLPECWWAESGEDAWARIDEFVEFVRQRPEERIAFVGHGGFWSMVIGQYLGNCKAVYCDRFLPLP